MRIFHISRTPTATPPASPLCLVPSPPSLLEEEFQGPVCYSQLQQYTSNSAPSLQHLDHPEDLQSILNSLQVPIFFLIPLQIDLVLLLKNALETVRRVSPLPTWRATSAECWGHTQRLSRSLVWNAYWRRKINKTFSITSGNRQNPKQQKGSVAL